MGKLSLRPQDGQALESEPACPQLHQTLRLAGFSIELRPYQSSVTLGVASALKRDERPLVVLPTGAGKTIVSASWISLSWARADAEGQQCLFVSHRSILSENAAATIARVTAQTTGIVGDGQSDWNADVICVTIQSLQSDAAWERLASRRIRMVIVDEAHRVSTPSYNRFFKRLLNLHPEVRIVGLTATPGRSDGKKLAPFNSIVRGPALDQLIEYGALVPPRFFVPKLLGHEARMAALANLAARNMDDMRSAAEILDGDLFNSGVVEEWQRRGEGRPTVVFTTTKRHAEHLAAAFCAAGVAAAAIHSSIRKSRRSSVLDAYEAGELQVLVNPLMLTEGWDSQRTACLILARPFASHVAFVQAIGRGLRSVDTTRYPDSDKSDCIVLDYADAIGRHGSLAVPADDEPQPRNTGAGSCSGQHLPCSKCDAVYAGRGPCPECGAPRAGLAASMHGYIMDGEAPSLQEILPGRQDDGDRHAPWYALGANLPGGMPASLVCNASIAAVLVASVGDNGSYVALAKRTNPEGSKYPWPLDAKLLERGDLKRCLAAANVFLERFGIIDRPPAHATRSDRKLSAGQLNFLRSQGFEKFDGLTADKASAAMSGVGFRQAYGRLTGLTLPIELNHVRPVRVREAATA